jgi:hypothetical protein
MSKKVAPSQKPSMKVSSDTKKKLKNLMTEENGLDKASLEEVVLWLLKESAGADGGEDADGEAAPGPEKRRKIYVREPLYSLEILLERNGMLEYLTGFEVSEFQLLTKRFQEVRSVSQFFCFPHGVVMLRFGVYCFDVLR